ncbi:MAG: right-handed parallel beta-helix repeat-containing protein, partial [Clostridiales bacterium]
MKQIKLTFVAMLLSVTLGVLLFTGSNTYKAKRTIYVDQANGNDSNTGISFSEAFKTIKKATEIISPGDICIVEKGNYPERVYISRSGNKNNLITFKAAKSGVITKGFTVEADYIRIEGFEITGTDPKSWKNGAGIHLKGKYCEILNNYIHNVYLEGIRLGADLVSPETSNCLVKANRMIRCGQAGIQVGGQKNVIDSNEISGTIQWAKTNPQ